MGKEAYNQEWQQKMVEGNSAFSDLYRDNAALFGARLKELTESSYSPSPNKIEPQKFDINKPIHKGYQYDDVKEQGAEKNNFTFASAAARVANPKMLEHVINNGADLSIKDPQGNTPLRNAVASNVSESENRGTSRYETVKMILKDANGKKTINEPDAQGFTPLMKAVEKGDAAMVGILKASGSIVIDKDLQVVKERSKDFEKDSLEWKANNQLLNDLTQLKNGHAKVAENSQLPEEARRAASEIGKELAANKNQLAEVSGSVTHGAGMHKSINSVHQV